MINRIDKKFQEDKKLLSIYFSAGHPSLEDTVPVSYTHLTLPTSYAV